MHPLTLRITGFTASLLLTFAAYFIILNPNFLGFDIQWAVIAIFIFALIQSLVQLLCFIDAWKEEEALWNLVIFISTISIIFIIVFFSIWIINHLNYNMH